ncbi:hypothetical protein [Chitinimonas sp. BJYL2]|uniref:hypothetical protein n=1 Tax=Chitinimonas sp. BJYL2 TaxID=2976696 RepID=UPI0022B3C42D|nr:hypothetical protein [Chitinimonas sp. BJYL2]
MHHEVKEHDLDWWVLKQLKAQVEHDLVRLIPDGYFEQSVKELEFNESIGNSEHFSREMKWGYLAGVLGKKLFFESSRGLSPRELSASEMLMHLGMYTSAECMEAISRQIAEKAQSLGVPDGNSSVVADQLKANHLVVLRDNITGALTQYLKHLSDTERNPYMSLLGAEDENERNSQGDGAGSVVNNFQVSVTGSVNGSVQVGEGNVIEQAEVKRDSPFKWLSGGLAKIISGVLIAVIGAYVLKSLGMAP